MAIKGGCQSRHVAITAYLSGSVSNSFRILSTKLFPSSKSDLKPMKWQNEEQVKRGGRNTGNRVTDIPITEVFNGPNISSGATDIMPVFKKYYELTDTDTHSFM